MQSVLIWLPLVCLNVVRGSAPRPYTLHIQSLTVANMDTSIVNLSITHNRTYMSMAMDIPTTVRVPIMMQVIVDVKARDGNSVQGYFSLLNVSLDFCQFLVQPTINPLVNLFFAELRRDSRNKIMKQCPIEAGHYSIPECTLNIGDLSLTLPSMFYNFKLMIHVQGLGVVGKNWRTLVEVRSLGDMGNIRGLYQRRRRT